MFNENILKLMYITNDVSIAKIADNYGVDRIFIDLETNGKLERQGHLDTVISNHKIEDISKIKEVLKKSKILVRVNPIYEGSDKEINEVINSGADIVMLPFFKTVNEVLLFIKFVNKRARVCLLCETVEAVEKMDDILKLDGIDEIHIGLNDLHLGYKKKFMFELISDGTVEKICRKIQKKGIPYGFGGIARVGEGKIPAEQIIIEHYRLNSKMVILSRSFFDLRIVKSLEEIEEKFQTGIKDIRNLEEKLKKYNDDDFTKNKNILVNNINKFVNEMKS